MAKLKTRYICQACGSETHRWQGQCPDCSEWNTLVQEAANLTVFAAKHNLQGGGRAIELVGLDAAVALPDRMRTGIEEFDRAIGGGIVPGSAMLLGGDPGIGRKRSAKSGERRHGHRSGIAPSNSDAPPTRE